MAKNRNKRNAAKLKYTQINSHQASSHATSNQPTDPCHPGAIKIDLSSPVPLSKTLLNNATTETITLPLEEANNTTVEIAEDLLKTVRNNKRKSTTKEFGELEVKVLKEHHPWVLPPIKIDKSAYDFYQHALYGNRALSRRRSQMGLALEPGLIGPAPKFIRD